MNSIPVPPNSLPGLAPLLSGELWQRWVDRDQVFPIRELHEAVRYVRLKPRTSCRIAIFANDGTKEDFPLGFLLHLYADRARAVEAFRKLRIPTGTTDAHPFLPFLDEEYAAVATPFPFDPELPALRHACRPFRLKTALSTLLPHYHPASWRYSKSRTRMELLAYKPGRRAVFRTTVHLEHRESREILRLSLHVKVEHSSTVANSYEKLIALHRATQQGGDWSVPQPLGMVEERGLVVSAWGHGRPLLASLANPSMDTAIPLRSTGRALAGFHRLTPTLRESDRSPGAGEIIGLARDVADILPDETTRLAALSTRLANLSVDWSGSSVHAIHGDFHIGQVVVGSQHILIVDLDCADLGHPVVDTGSFLASLVEAGVDESGRDAFLDGYHQEAPGPLDTGLLRAATAVALFRRVAVPLRQFDPAWPDRIRERLDQIEQLMGAVTL